VCKTKSGVKDEIEEKRRNVRKEEETKRREKK
jgi:hypothetical protein